MNRFHLFEVARPEKKVARSYLKNVNIGGALVIVA
jgi:hypothetical protein